MIYAETHEAASGQKPLTLDIAEAAVEIAEWFSYQQLSLLAAGRSEKRVEWLEKLKLVLNGLPNRCAPMRVLGRSHGFERSEIDALAQEFRHVVRVETVRSGEAGRPAVIVSLLKGA